ncbi:hypothetical protein [Geodermatophilus sp. SYSU D01119]
MVAAWVLVALAALLALGCAVAVRRLARPGDRPRRERHAAARAAAGAAVPPPGRGARGR